MLGLGLAVAWLLGNQPLTREVSNLRAYPLSVQFDWPVVSNDDGPDATWVPAVVQDALVHLVMANVSDDPYDMKSLERGRLLLESTGWFTRVTSIERHPGGVISVQGEWRVPVALVRKSGREFLIGNDAAAIRIPDGFKAMPGLFAIENPAMDPPMQGDRVRYGKPWIGGDVQAALALLRLLKDSPVAAQIASIDLSEFLSAEEPKLVIVTDRKTKVIWGAAIGELAPGQVSIDRRVARLEQQLESFGHIDAHQDRLDISTPIVMVNRTQLAVNHAE